MAGLAGAMMQAFEDGYDLPRRLRAKAAATEQYGEAAGAPGLFSALGQEARAQANEPRLDDQNSRANANEARLDDSNARQNDQNTRGWNNESRLDDQNSRAERGTRISEDQNARQGVTHNAEMEDREQAKRQTAVLGVVQGIIKARDDGGDVGKAFDDNVEILKTLGIAEEDLPAMRQKVIDDPKMLDGLLENIRGQGGEMTPEPKPAAGSNARLTDNQKALAIMEDPDASDAQKAWAAEITGVQPEGDQSTQDVAAARVSNIVSDLKGFYENIDADNGITNTNKGPISNATAYIRSTWLGRKTGQVFGTDPEGFRRSIDTIRPHLITAMKAAEKMGARMFDSNKDMELWMATVSDPTQDYDTVMRALDTFERMYGEAIEDGTLKAVQIPDIYPGFISEEGHVFNGGENIPSNWTLAE